VQEIREIKNNQAKKKWEDVAAQNFHRSLDHRSYFFKQSEKKVTSHKSNLFKHILSIRRLHPRSSDKTQGSKYSRPNRGRKEELFSLIY